MALSYFAESEAPRDFRVSSTDSDGHYKKCLLCFTVRKNFYCPECIRAGNFVQSSMPYSDRFAEKQAKLLRLKANRRHVLDRCEKLLAPKVKRDTLHTEAKQSRDKIELLRLAIEQRRNNIEERKKELTELVQYNNELRLKLPRYQKRVSSLGKHAQVQRMELQNKISTYNDQAQLLAALRRSRIRQLTKYIFPVYMTYDSSDSIEDMEFVGDDAEEEVPRQSQLHIVAPWINADGDFSHMQACLLMNKASDSSAVSAGGGGGAGGAVQRTVAALALAAQLVSLAAATLDVRLPHAMPLGEYCNWRVTERGVWWRARRLSACAAALCARGGCAPPSPPPPPAPPRAPLHAIDILCTAAAADLPELGRVEAWMSQSVAAGWEAWAPPPAPSPPPPPGPSPAAADAEGDDLEPPEHLHWPETLEMDELSSTPPGAGPAPSLVTSAAASIISMWRGWTK